MGRKPREDRESVASLHLGLRLTPDLAAMLMAMVDRANAVATANGLPPGVTASSLVRRWIEERLRAETGSPQTTPMVKVGGGRLEGPPETAPTETPPQTRPRKGTADYMREAMEATGGTWRGQKKKARDS